MEGTPPRVQTEGRPLTRRSFLGGAVVLVCAPAGGLSCDGRAQAPDSGVRSIDGWNIPPGTKLSPERHAVLLAAMDALIPAAPGWPGATRAGAAWYLDQLLGAFDADPPRIYAGGPYSGRHGGLDGFSRFQRLTRVEELRWRTYLEGSQGIPEREFNGPVVGLLQRCEEGLDALDRAARGKEANPFAALALERRRSVLLAADGEFVQLLYEYAAEGTYGDPVYGGNRDTIGWEAISYEGDRQPVGYTPRQMSNPEEG